LQQNRSSSSHQREDLGFSWPPDSFVVARIGSAAPHDFLAPNVYNPQLHLVGSETESAPEQVQESRDKGRMRLLCGR
jgi:hypothetical protein